MIYFVLIMCIGSYYTTVIILVREQFTWISTMRITDKSLVEQQKISEAELRRRLELFRLSQSDILELRALKGIVTRKLEDLVTDFYQHQTLTPDVETLIGDAGTLKRLILALKQYILDIFSRDIDLEYVEHRLRIGLVHKRIGVDPKLYLSAVNYLKDILSSAISENISDETYAKSLQDTLCRLIDFDVSFVFDTYIKSMVNELELEKNKSISYAHELETVVLERTKSLEKMARLDPLTNLYNKRTFEEKTQQLISDSIENNEAISLIYIDIDNFKMFNDDYGHEEGDMVLILVSDCIRAVSRNVDSCYRFGGDEFVIVMPGCTKESANENYVPRLKEEIEKVRTDITLSIGIAQSGPKDYLSLKDTLVRADKEMYEKKKQKPRSLRQVQAEYFKYCRQ